MNLYSLRTTCDPLDRVKIDTMKYAMQNKLRRVLRKKLITVAYFRTLFALWVDYPKSNCKAVIMFFNNLEFNHRVYELPGILHKARNLKNN